MRRPASTRLTRTLSRHTGQPRAAAAAIAEIRPRLASGAISRLLSSRLSSRMSSGSGDSEAPAASGAVALGLALAWLGLGKTRVSGGASRPKSGNACVLLGLFGARARVGEELGLEASNLAAHYTLCYTQFGYISTRDACEAILTVLVLALPAPALRGLPPNHPPGHAPLQARAGRSSPFACARGWQRSWRLRGRPG